MKKILLLALPLMAMCFASCEKDKGTEASGVTEDGIIIFKDQNFLDALLKVMEIEVFDPSFGDDIVTTMDIDKNKDRQISLDEAKETKALNLYDGETEYGNVSDLVMYFDTKQDHVHIKNGFYDITITFKTLLYPTHYSIVNAGLDSTGHHTYNKAWDFIGVDADNNEFVLDQQRDIAFCDDSVCSESVIKTIIQYDNIMVGSMLKINGNFYVLIEDQDDPRISEYDTLRQTIAANPDAPKIFVADLSDSFNSSYLSSESNYESDMTKFKVTGTTLVKIENHKITETYDSYDEINDKLKELE